MKRLFIAGFACLLVGMLATAFTPPTGDLSSEILQKSKAELESLQDLTAQFTYQIESPQMKQAIAKKGALKYKGGMYQIDLPGQKIYCDAQTMWIYLVDDLEVNILEYDPEDALSPESIFQIYETSAKSRYEGEETVHGVKSHKIFLAIQDERLDYNQAYVWINKRSNLLEKMSVINRNQTTTTYEFSQIKTNSGYDRNDFVLQVESLPADVEVYDER
ncbi:MAG: outer membrane lipoprotein carrier protein LolA [Bacteroidota bacterium]